MQASNVGRMLSEAPPAEAQCEALFELFTGQLGVLELGRLLKGGDAGRLVLLRKLTAAPSADLASASDLSRSLAHPRLAKLLGMVRDKHAWYVASEYIPSVSLLELTRAVAERGTPLDTAVAVRIVLDLLKAAKEAHELLSVTANLDQVRSIHAESVWIAPYGEVFISELLVASALADERAAREQEPAENSAAPCPVGDAASALAELARLLRIVPGPEQAAALEAVGLVPELRELLRNSLERFEIEPTLDGVIAALDAQASAHGASEEQVAAELEHLVGRVLERRSQKIEMLERSSLHAPADDEATRYFRIAPAPIERETTRPPPAPERPASIAPPTTDPTALLGNIVPVADPVADAAATEPPPTVIDSHDSVADAGGDAISAVWRQARPLLDTAAQRAKRHGKPRSRRASRRSEPRPSAPAEGAPVEAAPPLRFPFQKLLLALISAVALALLIRLVWAARGH